MSESKSIQICPKCGKEFSCGIEAGDVTCWCFSFPKVPIDEKSEHCLCPACLLEKISLAGKITPE